MAPAYRPRSPTDCATFTVKSSGLPRRSGAISSQTFSSLRQTGRKPSWRLASFETSAKGFGAAGSGRAAGAAPGTLGADAAGAMTTGAVDLAAGGVVALGAVVAQPVRPSRAAAAAMAAGRPGKQ